MTTEPHTHSQIHRLAANNTGEELTQQLINRVSALMVQQQAMACQWRQELLDIGGCDCDNCQEARADLLGDIETLAMSRQKLIVIGDLIQELGVYEHTPAPEDLEAFMRTVPGGDE